MFRAQNRIKHTQHLIKHVRTNKTRWHNKQNTTKEKKAEHECSVFICVCVCDVETNSRKYRSAQKEITGNVNRLCLHIKWGSERCTQRFCHRIDTVANKFPFLPSKNNRKKATNFRQNLKQQDNHLLSLSIHFFLSISLYPPRQFDPIFDFITEMYHTRSRKCAYVNLNYVASRNNISRAMKMLRLHQRRHSRSFSLFYFAFHRCFGVPMDSM